MIIGSRGRLEIAVNCGAANLFYGANTGDKISIKAVDRAENPGS
jgi:S-adenosylmethionine hydrolase